MKWSVTIRSRPTKWYQTIPDLSVLNSHCISCKMLWWSRDQTPSCQVEIAYLSNTDLWVMMIQPKVGYDQQQLGKISTRGTVFLFGRFIHQLSQITGSLTHWHCMSVIMTFIIRSKESQSVWRQRKWSWEKNNLFRSEFPRLSHRSNRRLLYRDRCGLIFFPSWRQAFLRTVSTFNAKYRKIDCCVSLRPNKKCVSMGNSLKLFCR